MKISIFVLIVTVAAFCGGMAGSFIACTLCQEKRKKRRPNDGRKRGGPHGDY